MPKQSHIFLLCFVLFLLLNVQRALAGYQLYDDTKGLSHNFVTKIVKDNSGLMWVSTRDGLNTFDGYNFNEIPELRDQYINDMEYDSTNNRLWLGCTNGLFMLDIETRNVLNCTLKSDKKHVINLGFYNHNLYVVFSTGTIFEISPSLSISVVFTQPDTEIAGPYSLIAFDNRGHLYMLKRRNPALLVINLPERTHVVSKQFDATRIWSIYDGNGYCIVNLNNRDVSLYTYSSERPFIKNIKLPSDIGNESIRLISQYRHEFYVAMRESYEWYVLDSTTNVFKRPYSQKTDELFKAWTISSLFHDGNTILWIGTNKGLIKSTQFNNYPFHHIFGSEGKTVSTRQIIEGKKDHLYIASYDGIYEYNKINHQTNLLTPHHQPSNFPLYSRSLYYDRFKYLYSGSESNTFYFYRYNIEQQKFESGFFNLQSGGIELSSTYFIHPDPLKHGKLWLATDKGLASYEQSNETIQLHYNDSYSTGIGRIMYISRALNPSQFWTMGEDGISLVDSKKGRIAHFSNATNRLIPQDEFIYGRISPDGDLWVGSAKSGIIIIDKNLKDIRVINRSNGVPTHNIYGILWSDNHTAWISTSNGLCRYDTQRNRVHIFLTDNGLTDNEFNQNSVLQSDKLFYFGGINGVNYFTPNDIPSSGNQVITIFCSAISKWNDGKLIPVTTNGKHISINPDDHLLSFNVGISDYLESESNSYFYRIKESRSDWIPLGNTNKLRIDGLPAGNHTIEIIGFNKYGERSTNTLTYHVFIQQVFYKRFTFYLLLVFIILIIAFLIFRWKIRNIAEKQKLRTQIASNLHDEVGSLLTSIIISTDSARYASHSVEEKNSKLEKISHLSRMATNTMSDVLWSVDARNDYAGNLTDRMREHAENMLDPLGIDIEFVFSSSIQKQIIQPDIRQQLYLIFKEALNNIIKHSKATRVVVTYQQSGHSFRLVIENNNHLLYTESAGYSGQGLKNMEMRAQLIHASCSFKISGDTYAVIIQSQ